MARFDIAQNIVNRAALELGLGKLTGDPFQSQDPNVQQLAGFLSTVGQRLLSRSEWSHLRAEWSFTTQDGDTGTYPLPADFLDMVPQTGWDRTKRMPLGGPLSAQEWQYLKAWSVGVTVTALFRMNQNEIVLYPQPPPVGVTVALEYRSSSWVTPQGAIPVGYNYNTLGPAGSDTVTAGGDVCLFDPTLLMLGIKHEFLKAKGFDTSATQQDFVERFEEVLGTTSTAPVLSLNGPKLGLRLLDGNNLPISGWGK